MNRAIYVIWTAFWAIGAIVGGWVAFTDDDITLRCVFALGGAVFAWTAYSRTRWLISSRVKPPAATPDGAPEPS